jgi:hydrogenase nickel incorporation protein HypA/HybF
MHELGIAHEIVEMVSARTSGSRVTRVVVRVGKLAAVMPDALRFSFDVVADGTNVEGASLEIEETPGEDLAIVRAEVA